MRLIYYTLALFGFAPCAWLELVCQAMEDTDDCLNLMKETLGVLGFLDLLLELKVVAGSLSRNRSPRFWKSHVLEFNPGICRLTTGSAGPS